MNDSYKNETNKFFFERLKKTERKKFNKKNEMKKPHASMSLLSECQVLIISRYV